MLAYLMNNTNMGNLSYIPAILVGLIVGYIAFTKLSEFFIAALGAMAGMIIALVIISILNIQNDLIVYLLIIGGFVIGFFMHFMTSTIELFICILTGAYLVVEGITTFLGGLPSLLFGI